MLGPTGHVDLGVSDEARQRAAHEGTGVPCGGDVGIVQHGVAVAAQPAVVAGLGFAEERNEPRSLCRRELAGRAQPEACKRRAHRLDIDRVSHHCMIDRERSGPGRRHAHHHDLMVEQLDTGRRAASAGPQRPVDADVSLGQRRPLELRKRDGGAEGAGGARKAHRLQGIACRHHGTPAVSVSDPLGNEQWAFYLDEVDVGRIIDTGIRHGSAHAGRHLINLLQSAEMLEWERRRVGTADGKRRLRSLLAVAALEHQPMRRHGALGTARHHEANLRRLPRGKMTLEQ